jgi:hypothetical protein
LFHGIEYVSFYFNIHHIVEEAMITRIAHSTHMADSHWMLVAALALINVVLLLVF